VCCELISLLIASISSAHSRRIGVVCVFVAWLQLRPRALDDGAVPLAVQRSFFRGLAHLLNTAARFMAAERSHAAASAQGRSAEEENGWQLFEEAEVQGCALLLPLSSSSSSAAASSSSSSSFSAASPLLGQPTSAGASGAHDDADEMEADDTPLDPAGASPAQRRCARLLRLGAWMAKHGVGIARDDNAATPASSFGIFRSLLEPAPSALPVAAAEVAMIDHSNTMAAPPPPLALSSIHPASSHPIGSTSAAARLDPSAPQPIIAALPPMSRDGHPLAPPPVAGAGSAHPDSALTHSAVVVAAPATLAPTDATAAELPPAAAPRAPDGLSRHDAVDEDCHMSDNEHSSAAPLHARHTSASVAMDDDSASAAPIMITSNAAVPTLAATAPAASTGATADPEPGWRVSPAARATGLDLFACYRRVMFPSFASPTYPAPSARPAPAAAPAAAHVR